MGLFDQYATDTSAPQGGLLDRLLSAFQQNAQNQAMPGALPSDTASYDAQPTAPSPAQMNAPLLPAQVSAQAAPTPQQPIQPSAAPPPQAAAPAVQPTALPPQLQTPQPTNPLLAIGQALHSAAHGGSFFGAITGNPDDAASVQRRNLKAQYDALVNAGVPQQQAILAVINPEAGKAIIAQALGPKHLQSLGQGYVADDQGKVTRAYEPDDTNQVVQIGEDALGQKKFGVFNKGTGAITPYQAPGASDTNDNGLRGDASKTGADYLATLPKGESNIVGGMIDGTIPIPAGNALGKQIWINRLADAKQADPTFDATTWSGRIAGRKDFLGGGKSSEMVRSANQTLQHVNALLDSADALHNGNYPALNYLGNKANEAMGAGEPGAFVTNAHAVADEMGKVFKGANLSDSEIHAWADALSPNMSPAQQRAQIGKMTELLHGALDALDEKRTSSIGQVAADKAGPIIKPAGQAVLQRIDQWIKAGNGAAPAGGTAPTGVKWSVVQ